MMTTYTTAEARNQLPRLIDEANDSHKPITIVGERKNAVLVSDAHYRGLQETLYLLSIPGMLEKLLEGMATPIEDCIPYEEVLRELEDEEEQQGKGAK